jgi:putative DNA primase/helicase
MADGAYAYPAAPSPEEMARFDLNDLGNAMRLIRLAGGQIDEDGEVDITHVTLLYQLGLGWVGYNGRYWDKKFGDQLARKLAHQVAHTMRGLYEQLTYERPAGRGLSPAAAMKFIDQCGSRGSTSAMLAQAESYLTVEIDAFDQHALTVNCRNGTLWLIDEPKAEDPAKRFRVVKRKHQASDRITRLVDVDYDPKAAAPLFRATVEASLPDLEVAAFFKRAQGYSATGCVHEQAMFICQGLGRDGKSTILDALRETLGGYGAVGQVATFLDLGTQQASGAAPDIVKLSGDVRMVVLSEPPRGGKLNEGLLKAWTSGSPISARELREKPFDFRPIGKLWMECNAFPVARGDDDGVWRRIKPILFENQVPEDRMDRMLPVKLKGEKAGILNWLIEGVGDWLARGLDPPDRVRKALEDYRKQSSPFGDWLNERCVWGKAAEGVRTLSGDLYANYKSWAEDQGHDRPMSQRAFGDALHQRQILLAGKDTAGKKYRGPIRLKTGAELSADQARSEAAAGRSTGGSAGGQLGPEAFERSSYEPGAFDADDDLEF